jgi:hypothetical protein
LGARKHFSRNQTLKLEKLEGSKPDDVAITLRKGPFSGYKTLKLWNLHVHPYSAFTVVSWFPWGFSARDITYLHRAWQARPNHCNGGQDTKYTYSIIAQHHPGNWLICCVTYCATLCELARNRAGWLDSPLLSKTITSLLDKLYSSFHNPP